MRTLAFFTIFAFAACVTTPSESVQGQGLCTVDDPGCGPAGSYPWRPVATSATRSYSNDYVDGVGCSGDAQSGSCWIAIGSYMYTCQTTCDGTYNCNDGGCTPNCDTNCWTSELPF